MKDLRGSVALITGASMGIGAAIAEELAARGCKVALLARTLPALQQVVDQIRQAGGIAEALPCDASDPSALAQAVATVERTLGPVSILVNNVGAGTFKPIDRMTAQEAMLSVDLPLRAAVAACHAVVPGMKARRAGQIVNLTSPAGYFPLPNMVPYTAARHAMRGLSLSLREELREHGIGVSLLCPAQVDTGYFERNDADMAWYPKLSRIFPVLAPARVAREAALAILHDRREVIFPWSLWLVTRLFMLAPRLNIFLARLLGLWGPSRS